MDCYKPDPAKRGDDVKVIRGLTASDIAFAEQRIGQSLPGGTTGIVSVTDLGDLAGVVALTPVFRGNSNIYLAAARRVWLTPELFQATFELAFEDLKSLRITAVVETSNLRSLRLVKSSGFRLEGHCRGFESGDILIFGLLREDYK